MLLPRVWGSGVGATASTAHGASPRREGSVRQLTQKKYPRLTLRSSGVGSAAWAAAGGRAHRRDDEQQLIPAEEARQRRSGDVGRWARGSWAQLREGNRGRGGGQAAGEHNTGRGGRSRARGGAGRGGDGVARKLGAAAGRGCTRRRREAQAGRRRRRRREAQAAAGGCRIVPLPTRWVSFTTQSMPTALPSA